MESSENASKLRGLVSHIAQTMEKLRSDIDSSLNDEIGGLIATLKELETTADAVCGAANSSPKSDLQGSSINGARKKVARWELQEFQEAINRVYNDQSS